MIQEIYTALEHTDYRTGSVPQLRKAVMSLSNKLFSERRGGSLVKLRYRKLVLSKKLSSRM